jgi:hypothetical protein
MIVLVRRLQAGVLALVTVQPRRDPRDLHLSPSTLPWCSRCSVTGGGDSPFVNLFFPLVAVNAYYFGRWVGLLTVLAGLSCWTAAWMAPPRGSGRRW